MKLVVTKGATSQIWYVKVRHATTGAPLPGLAFGSSGLTAYYVRPGAAAVAITLVTQTVTGAYSSGGFVEVSSANMPGVYRFDPPNAVVATGVDCAVVTLKGAADMEQVDIELQLTSVNLQDAVRFGITALPNASAGTAGGLMTCTIANVLPADAVSAGAWSAAASAELIAALNATVIESQGSITFQQAMQVMLAILAGRNSGGSFSTPNNGAVRAAFTYTGNDRTGVTLTP